MSWYSELYTYGRALRAKSPLLGYLLQLSFYLPLLLNLAVLFSVTYVYVFIVTAQLTSAIQISVYLITYGFIVFMLLWSLLHTVTARHHRVPDHYALDEHTDVKLRSVTIFRPDGRADIHMEDAKNAEELAARQRQILDAFAMEKRLRMVELEPWDRLRYCYSCRVLKPDRSHHCSSCGFCSLRFDHHCPYINSCVGFHNYKYFVLLLLYVELWLIWSWTTSLEAVLRFALKHGGDPGHLGQLIAMLIMVAFTAASSCWPIGALLHYHWGLIVLNETTCEQAKIPRIRGDDRANYDIGKWNNVEAAFGWGLWLFPVNTACTDGLHYPINYMTPGSGDRMRIGALEEDSEGDEEAEDTLNESGDDTQKTLELEYSLQCDL